MVERGKKVFRPITMSPVSSSGSTSASMRDMFLHALFARLALSDNENIEFKTEYNPSTNEIELVVPDDAIELFDQLTGVQRGDKFKAFINWLIGSDSFIPAPITYDQDPNFVPASSLSAWAGAPQGSLDGKQVVLHLPAGELSVLGYNTKIDDTFDQGSLDLYLIWVYDSGTNSDFYVKTSAKLTDISTGGGTTEKTETTSISTLNLLKGDIRETKILSIDSVYGGDVCNIMIFRNYNGSPDAQVDLTGVIGLRLELNG